MAINFGLASLKGYRNGWETGCACTTGAGNTGIAIASGSVWLDGINCALTAITVTMGTEGVHTGTGGYVYAVLPTANSSTAAATATIKDLTGKTYAAIAKFSFGTGGDNTTLVAQDATLALSAKTALVSFARAYNVAINVTYDQAIARGGTLVFGDDIKFFNGAIEGNAEYAEMDVEALSRLLGGSYASGGDASGTWSVSATNRPFPFMLEANVTTDGVTGRVRVFKCYSNQLTMNFDRENFLVPNLSFVAVAGQDGRAIELLE